MNFLEPAVLFGFGVVLLALAISNHRSGKRGPRRWSIVGLVLIVWLLVFAPAATFTRTRLDVDAFERIRDGMPLERVEQMLGGPSGHYGRFAEGGVQTDEGDVGWKGSALRIWTNDSASLEVAFVNDRVIGKHRRAAFSTHASVSSRLKRIARIRAVDRHGPVDFEAQMGGDPRPTQPPPRPGREPLTARLVLPEPAKVVSVPLSDCVPTLSQFATGLSRSKPTALVAGPDGAVWFVEHQRSRIGRITSRGDVWTHKLERDAEPSSLTLGRDGAIWFGDAARSTVSRLATDGVLDEFRFSPAGPEEKRVPGLRVGAMTLGPDDAVWFADEGGRAVYRVSQAGKMSASSVVARAYPFLIPTDLETGPDGRLWVTRSYYDKVDRMEPGSRPVEHATVPKHEMQSRGRSALARGTDSMWLSNGSDFVARIALDGSVRLIALGTGAIARSLTVAPDGTVWVLDEGRNTVLSVTPAGRIDRSFALDANVGFGSAVRDGITVGSDGAIWFVEPALGKIGRIGCPTTD